MFFDCKQFISEMGVLFAKARRSWKGLLPRRAVLADFVFEACIGRGACGDVFRVVHRVSGQRYALKRVRRGCAASETRALQVGRSPFLVALHAVLRDECSSYLQLRLAPLGDLRAQLRARGRLPELLARLLVAQVLVALSRLHARGVVHCDVKPENVLLSERGHALLADLGLSRTGESAGSAPGTPAYLSPEVLRAETGNPFARDFWAWGVLLYELVEGCTPFAANGRYQTYQRIVENEARPAEVLSADGRAFVARLLERETPRRLGGGPRGAQEVRSDPYFTGVDWRALERGECPDLHAAFATPEE